LTSLTELWLDGNALNGPFPAELGKLTSLTELSLGDNKLSGTILSNFPWIGNLKSLQKLYLDNNQLSGSIPSVIANLTQLTALSIVNNQLSGSIPSEIIKLELRELYLSNNPSLSGFFTPGCYSKVVITNTSVTLCGCSSKKSPASRFPPAGTSLECLSTGPATPLAKRALVFSQNIGALKYTCNSDKDGGNPYQDCLNAQGAICHTDYIGTNSTRLDDCKKGVDQMTKGLSSYWQDVRKSCGQWSFAGAAKGLSTSSNCINANSALQKYAFYTLDDGTKLPVTSILTDSVISGLWSKIN